jgi:hypothetical protein
MSEPQPKSAKAWQADMPLRSWSDKEDHLLTWTCSNNSAAGTPLSSNTKDIEISF